MANNERIKRLRETMEEKIAVRNKLKETRVSRRDNQETRRTKP